MAAAARRAKNAQTEGEREWRKKIKETERKVFEMSICAWEKLAKANEKEKKNRRKIQTKKRGETSEKKKKKH